MDILILGANGMLGPAVIEALQSNHRLRLTDINDLETQHEYLKVDVSSLDQVVQAARGMDAIINLSVLREDVNLAFDVNFRGTYNTMVAALENGISRVVNTGPHFTVAGETYDGFDFQLSPDMPAQPGVNLYAITKSLGHEACRIFARIHPINVISLFFYTFTSTQQIRKTVGSATYITEWRDASEAVKLALEIGTEKLPSTYEAFFILADMPHGKYVNEKAKRILGWEPKYLLEKNWTKSNVPHDIDPGYEFISDT